MTAQFTAQRLHQAAPTPYRLTRIGLNMNVSDEDSPISPILDERAVQCSWCETNRQSSCQEDGLRHAFPPTQASNSIEYGHPQPTWNNSRHRRGKCWWSSRIRSVMKRVSASCSNRFHEMWRRGLIVGTCRCRRRGARAAARGQPSIAAAPRRRPEKRDRCQDR